MQEATLSDYLALMRLNKPIGIWLLFFPAAWGVLLSPAPLDPSLLLAMLLGAVLTRSAGCILNDLTDRTLDAGVARTRRRPLAAGTVPVLHATILLGVLGALALALAASLPRGVLAVALLAVPMIAAYPWMKRITWWPQLFLGLTFNLGAIIGWLATGASFALPPLLLYFAAVAWTLGYDTLYALQDMDDDRRAGMRSTALLMEGRVGSFVAACFIAMQLLLIAAGAAGHAGIGFLAGIVLVALHMRRQMRRLEEAGNAAGGRLFLSNQWLGLAMTLCMLADRLVE